MTLQEQLLLFLEDGSATYREIGDAFADVLGYEKRKAIFATLARLKRQSLIVQEKKKPAEYSLTTKGIQVLPKEPEVIPRPDHAWDRRWIILIEGGEGEKRAIEIYRALLRGLGFGKLGTAWFGVHAVVPKLLEERRNLNVERAFAIAEVELFHLADERELARKVWNLDGLAQDYRHYIDGMKSGPNGRNLPIRQLRFFTKLRRLEFLEIRTRDPVLPKELLPRDWPGGEAERIFEGLERLKETL